MMLLADNAICIMENANLERVGDARVGGALLVVTPLKIEGATGSPLRRAGPRLTGCPAAAS